MYCMTGRELKELADAEGLGLAAIMHEAGIESPRTLYKVYKDEPVRLRTKVRVEQAIQKLAAQKARERAKQN